ncbi:hypothetical protein ACHAQA_003137 [Verticillium albo-atrum]
MSLSLALLSSMAFLVAGVRPGYQEWSSHAENFHRVETTSGTLEGHFSDWQPQVTEFLGVPYAKPPVGSLRFAAPQPLVSQETIEAKTFGAACPGIFFTNTNLTASYESVGEAVHDQMTQFGEPFSEDCLSLNIWTRSSRRSKGEKRAVLLWVHGGAFFSGSTRWVAYEGAKMANDFDVVVVTINYRLSVFGFPTADFLEDVNPALYDVRLAVEWVRDNIEKFGGDPFRITLFGQSSGAAAIHDYAFAHTKDPIANAFILQSTFTGWGYGRENKTRKEAARPWYDLTERLGCGSDQHGARTLACMRQKHWEEIMGAGMDLAFYATPDEKTWFGNILDRMKAGKFARMVGVLSHFQPHKLTFQQPVLVGSTSDEGAFSIYLGSDPEEARYYGGQHHCMSSDIAAGRTLHDVPVRRYVYAGDWPNQNLGVGGPWHGSDIGMVFGTSELMARRPNTAEQTRLSWIMGKAWTDFAKDPYGGLDTPSWPTYDLLDKMPSTMRFGANGSSRVGLEYIRERTADCNAPERHA